MSLTQFINNNPNNNERINNVMITARAVEFPWIIINTIRINGIGGIGKNRNLGILDQSINFCEESSLSRGLTPLQTKLFFSTFINSPLLTGKAVCPISGIKNNITMIINLIM